MGALVDAGLEVDVFNQVISDLNLSRCKISSKRVKRGGIGATKVDVIFPYAEKKDPATILTLLDRLSFPSAWIEKSKEVFFIIAKAEAKIHCQDINNLHLHELGSLDTLIDIAGSVAGIYKMGIEKVYASPVNLGKGTVKTAHGLLPVPAPATLEILKGAPVYSGQTEAELTTPTGAAILKGFNSIFGPIPPMKVEKIGYGAGEKELSSPNLLRILIGEMIIPPQEDRVLLMQTNIDDMNPQIYEYLIDSLYKKGALEVFLTPVQMKKNRPGILLSVLCEEQKEEELLDTIFTETTTLGVRICQVKRQKARREIRKFKTSLGQVQVKISTFKGNLINFSPEYEDCKKIALKQNLPLRKVYELVKKEINSKLMQDYSF